MVELLVRRGVTQVAEAAFQHRLWAPKLERLREVASVRVIRCEIEEAVARERVLARFGGEPERQRAHADAHLAEQLNRCELRLDAHESIRLDLPTLAVDTSSGYEPALAAVVAFARD